MRKLFFLCLLLSFLAGCSKVDSVLQDDGESVVSLCLSFDTVPGSRSIYGGVGDAIDDVCLWVFRSGRLESYRHLEGGSSAELSLMRGRSYSFYAIANVYDDLSESLSPGELDEEQLRELRLQFSSFRVNDSRCSLPMAAVLRDYVPSASASLTVPMERLFSRIVFRFEPDGQMLEQNASLKSVALKNSAMDVLPFTRNSCALETADGDCCTNPLAAMASGADSLVFYCLENCCGVSGNDDPRLKTPEDAPCGQPSYLEVKVGLDGSLVSGEVSYRFCLGGNNFNDYNLLRDHSYSLTLRSLYSSVDSGVDDWQISGDVLKGEGTRIGLYLGQFRRFKLSDGDSVEYYDSDTGRWMYFIGYNDDDMASLRFPSGVCLAAYYSEENGSSCNPDFYVYSTARSGDESVLIRVKHSDGSEDRYSLNPPALPNGFSGLGTIETNEDGYECSVNTIALDGRFGEVQASEFRIPEHYRYADLPYSLPPADGTGISSGSTGISSGSTGLVGEVTGISGEGFMTYGQLPLPDCLMDEWRASFDSGAQADAALAASWVWSLFDRLYLRGPSSTIASSESVIYSSSGELAASTILEDAEVADCLGCYADYLSAAGSPRLCFYGKKAMPQRRARLCNRVFSQELDFCVSEAFPGTGHLGECFNREFLSNAEKSDFGVELPAGVSYRADWSIAENVYARVASKSLRFHYPLGSKASKMAAGGPLHLHGRVVNRFTGREIDGDYEIDVILCLPLICTESVTAGGAGSFTLAATVAVASDSAFHENIHLWEGVFGGIFNSSWGVQAQLALGAEQRLFSPYPDPSDVEFEIYSGVDPEGYGPEFLARYAAAGLNGFRSPLDGLVHRSLDFYPSASEEMAALLATAPSPVYARLLLFEDVNTQITPAVDTYGQGERIFECLWGKLQ